MTRNPRVQRTPEEKWEVVSEGLRSGNIAETFRLMGSEEVWERGVAPTSPLHWFETDLLARPARDAFRPRVWAGRPARNPFSGLSVGKTPTSHRTRSYETISLGRIDIFGGEIYVQAGAARTLWAGFSNASRWGLKLKSEIAV